MLTIDALKAMLPERRNAYLEQTANAMKRDETMGVQARNDERRMRDIAVSREARAAEARAYFATLEAAGLWPVPATPGGAPCTAGATDVGGTERSGEG